MTRSSRYTASAIDVLEGLEPVRKRPGMYIGGTGADGLHHLLWEIVDNGVDEAMNGHATKIKVKLHPCGTKLTVSDNGRGIPVDIHPTEGVSALEVIMTRLHAGGKFESQAYKTSGGLHGVGASVVNALSIHLEASVRRDGHEWRQRYRRGRPRGSVERVGEARGHGTQITFEPDPEIFNEVAFDPARIFTHLEVKAYLNKGLRIVFQDQVNRDTHELHHEGGLADYLAATVRKKQLTSMVEQPFLLDRENGLKLSVALTWTNSPKEHTASFVNGIPTKAGGTHEQGARDALVKALRSFIDTHGLTPRGVSLQADDLREGVVCLISLMIAEPQFQGQTKDRLNNPDVRPAVDSAMRQSLEQWLHDNKSQGELIISRAVQAAKARVASRQAAKAVRRKSATSSRLNLPGKLADCSSSSPTDCELFVVEGDSAGGSAKQGRDRRTQAILPIRGKVLNAQQATAKKVLANKELSNVVTALGCGMGADFRADRLRYHRIILLMDADTDGHHITTLMLTFFFRYMRPLLEGGYVYIAQPPLYRMVAGKQTWWALDDADRDRILAELPSRAKPEITRFKGLGEMPPKTLFMTTLDPERRRLLKVSVSDPDLADRTLTDLMGEDTRSRFRFIMDRAAEVQALDV